MKKRVAPSFTFGSTFSLSDVFTGEADSQVNGDFARDLPLFDKVDELLTEPIDPWDDEDSDRVLLARLDGSLTEELVVLALSSIMQGRETVTAIADVACCMGALKQRLQRGYSVRICPAFDLWLAT